MSPDRRPAVSAFVITCAKTQQRLPSLLSELEGLHADLTVVRRFDVPQLPIHIFNNNLWREHFLEIKNIHFENLKALGFSGSRINQFIVSESRGRILSMPEMSLSAKITFALNSFLAQGAEYVIVIEDDLAIDSAICFEKKVASELNKVINFARSESADLIDIGSLPTFDMNFIRNHHYVSAHSHGSYSRTSRLMTRSTCCFLMSRHLVSVVLKNKHIQSLPIDFHLQYLYERARLEGARSFNGFWLTNGVFLNGSMAQKKTGIQTSIQD